MIISRQKYLDRLIAHRQNGRGMKVYECKHCHGTFGAGGRW